MDLGLAQKDAREQLVRILLDSSEPELCGGRAPENTDDVIVI